MHRRRRPRWMRSRPRCSMSTVGATRENWTTSTCPDCGKKHRAQVQIPDVRAIGSALMNALLAAADVQEVPLVVLLGSPSTTAASGSVQPWNLAWYRRNRGGAASKLGRYARTRHRSPDHSSTHPRSRPRSRHGSPPNSMSSSPATNSPTTQPVDRLRRASAERSAGARRASRAARSRLARRRPTPRSRSRRDPSGLRACALARAGLHQMGLRA